MPPWPIWFNKRTEPSWLGITRSTGGSCGLEPGRERVMVVWSVSIVVGLGLILTPLDWSVSADGNGGTVARFMGSMPRTGLSTGFNFERRMAVSIVCRVVTEVLYVLEKSAGGVVGRRG